MLFMVIEHFKPRSVPLIGERFKQSGRMLPEGVTYHGSWVAPGRAACYQVMEAPSAELVRTWTRQWDDLVEFDIIPVLPSADFWAGQGT
jgi:hypothetical protein